MADPHQIMTIIATVLHDCHQKADDGDSLDPEQAKHIAKCICEALADAGLQILPAQKN